MHNLCLSSINVPRLASKAYPGRYICASTPSWPHSHSTKSWHLHISPIRVPFDMHANYDVASQLHPGPWINFSTISWPCVTSSRSRDFHLNQIQVHLSCTHTRYLCLNSVQVPKLASPLHPSHVPPLTRSRHLHTNSIPVTSHFHQGT